MRPPVQRSLSSSGMWVPDHIVPLPCSTSVTHRGTLLSLSFCPSWDCLGGSPVPFPRLVTTVQPCVGQGAGFTSHSFHMYSAGPCEPGLKWEEDGGSMDGVLGLRD